MTHWLLRYDLAPDYLDRRAGLRSEHLALAWAASEAGDLLLGGAVGDAPTQALLLFTSAAAAEAFVARDPYVTQGLVTAWHVDEWKTVVGPTASIPIR
ncbi:YciI-like protein [uncultured Sphingomonas sp.]|uniref:YciI-like protein n=1 Tax=uncultured Sphingomonas sp. TaxID=158754 RepID=UPI002638909A|nr:YciI-like protein [uncultured Sphingomonas sp.]